MSADSDIDITRQKLKAWQLFWKKRKTKLFKPKNSWPTKGKTANDRVGTNSTQKKTEEMARGKHRIRASARSGPPPETRAVMIHPEAINSEKT